MPLASAPPINPTLYQLFRQFTSYSWQPLDAVLLADQLPSDRINREKTAPSLFKFYWLKGNDDRSGAHTVS